MSDVLAPVLRLIAEQPTPSPERTTARMILLAMAGLPLDKDWS